MSKVGSILRLTEHLSLVRAQSFSKWTTALLSEHRGQFSLGKALTFSDCHFPLSKQTVNASLSDSSVSVRHAAAHTVHTQIPILSLWGSFKCKRWPLFYKCEQSWQPTSVHLTNYEKIHTKRSWEKDEISTQPTQTPDAIFWHLSSSFKAADSCIIYFQGQNALSSKKATRIRTM